MIVIALYDYLCDTCKERFEVIKGMTDETPVIHQKCGKEARRAINRSFAIDMKGDSTRGAYGKLPKLKDFPDHNDWIDA